MNEQQQTPTPGQQRDELIDAAEAAERVIARAGWLDTGPDPEAVALRKLRQALAEARAETTP